MARSPSKAGNRGGRRGTGDSGPGPITGTRSAAPPPTRPVRELTPEPRPARRRDGRCPSTIAGPPACPGVEAHPGQHGQRHVGLDGEAGVAEGHHGGDRREQDHGHEGEQQQPPATEHQGSDHRHRHHHVEVPQAQAGHPRRPPRGRLQFRPLQRAPEVPHPAQPHGRHPRGRPQVVRDVGPGHRPLRGWPPVSEPGTAPGQVRLHHPSSGPRQAAGQSAPARAGPYSVVSSGAPLTTVRLRATQGPTTTTTRTAMTARDRRRTPQVTLRTARPRGRATSTTRATRSARVRAPRPTANPTRAAWAVPGSVPEADGGEQDQGGDDDDGGFGAQRGRVDPERREGGHTEGGQDAGPVPDQIPDGHAGQHHRGHEQTAQEEPVGGGTGGTGHVGDTQQQRGQRWVGGRRDEVPGGRQRPGPGRRTSPPAAAAGPGRCRRRRPPTASCRGPRHG